MLAEIALVSAGCPNVSCLPFLKSACPDTKKLLPFEIRADTA